jgi:hypothetical protein
MQILLKIFWQSSCSSTSKLGKIQISTEQGVVCILVTVRGSGSLLVNNKSNLKCSQGCGLILYDLQISLFLRVVGGLYQC